MSQRPESKFYQKLKQELPELILTRLENWAVLGTPDILAYNKNKHIPPPNCLCSTAPYQSFFLNSSRQSSFPKTLWGKRYPRFIIAWH
jgi:hypothetical protein